MESWRVATGARSRLSVLCQQAGFREQPVVATLLPIAKRGSQGGMVRRPVWLRGKDQVALHEWPLSRL